MKEKLLRIESSYFVAGAIWRKHDQGFWICHDAAPVIRWMIGWKTKRAYELIKLKGWSYSWI